MGKVLILLILLLCAGICIAQIAQPNDLHFNRLSIKNGLPEGVITATLQDKEGYIWIGTQAGLVRYDGYVTRLYQFGIEDPLNCTIASLYQDRSGELWVGTLYQGLYHYNRTTDTFVHYKHKPDDANSLSAGIIISMHDDRNGNLWLILADNFDLQGKHVGLFDTKKHQFKTFGILEKGQQYINASQFNNLFEDTKGRIWIGTNNGIYEYSPAVNKFIPHFASADSLQQKNITPQQEDEVHPGLIWMNIWDTKSGKGEGLWRYNTTDNTVKIFRRNPNDPTSIGTDTVTTIQNDSKGRLWVCSGNGLSLFEPSSERFINYRIRDRATDFWDNVIWQLKEDNAGNFWCAIGNRGLSFFDMRTKTFTRQTAAVKVPDALPADGIMNLLVDRSGTFWVGTGPQGLYWLNRRRSEFTIYKNAPGQSHHFPGSGSTSFAEEKDGTFWAWSSNGLYHWLPSSDSFITIKSMKRQAESNPWHINAMLIDRKGIIWCGTYGKGILRYDPETGKIKNFKNNIKDSTSLSFDYINTLFEDDKATIWIGTHGGGLCSFNRESGAFKQYPHTSYNNYISPDNHTLNDAIIYAICEDKQGQLWIGTNNGGVSRFNRESGTFTFYKNQSPGSTITAISEDSKGHLWVGTHASGLFLFNPNTNTFKKFSENDGLIYNGVLAINEDNEGNLWITSDRGISVLNIQTKKIRSLGTINGLPEEPENMNFFKTSQGRFLMSCSNGFISFDPGRLKADTALPVNHIEYIDIIADPTPGSKQKDSIIYRYGKNKINLRYNENRVTFNYVGLQYQNSALNQYAYKLDGYDKDWIPAGTQRRATYANLAPGSYTFHVKAANSDGVWNVKDDVITIIISPPWWLTWWAYALYALIAGSVVYILYRNRINQLKRKQAAQINVMVAAQEGERKRISRDLHDDVGTKLSALKLFLSSLHSKALGINNEEISSLAESSEQFITEAMQDVRRLLLNLSPAVLEEFGYSTAVEGLINKINQTKQIHFNLVMFGMKHRLPKEYELALYRITQELINNVLKHAEAKNVSLQIGQRDKKIILMIEDDGKGFDANTHKEGYGLQNLAARTKLMQGTMTIDSRPGRGTSVWIEIPGNFTAV